MNIFKRWWRQRFRIWSFYGVLKFSNQIFEEESCFLEVEVWSHLSLPTPWPGVSQYYKNEYFRFKVELGNDRGLEEVDASGGNRFVGCVSFIIIYIFIMFQFEFIYLYEYSLNNFYFFDCIVGFWVISRHSNYPSSVEKHKLNRRSSREEQPASW